MKEEWRPVVGYEGLYEVSNMGRVKSLPKRGIVEDKILKPTKHIKDGRLSVMISDGRGGRKRVTVHRLVALAFIRREDKTLEVNHKDEDPTNNRADNLEWCTRRYNMNYGTTPQRLNVKNRKPVIGENKDTVVEYGAVRWGKKDGYDSGGILYSIRTGNAYKGMVWRYKHGN